MILRKSQKSRSRVGEKAKMKKGWGDGAPTGEAKIALSCRRELNFQEIAKKTDFLEKTEIALSCRREGQNCGKMRFCNSPGEAKMESREAQGSHGEEPVGH